jgi:hypothetical protein
MRRDILRSARRQVSLANGTTKNEDSSRVIADDARLDVRMTVRHQETS